MEKTAIQLALDYFIDNEYVSNILNNLIEKEKNQIRKAYNAGAKWGSDETSEDYYNENYKKNEK